MYALLINSLISLGSGLLGGTLIGFTLRARVWRLEHEQANFEKQLTREVKSRAAGERWAGEKISASVLKDVAALTQTKNSPAELSREQLRTSNRPN
jgi:hypothetical protein